MRNACSSALLRSSFGAYAEPVPGPQRFVAWCRALDERVLGPGGLLPDDTSLSSYYKQSALASASPMWVRAGRVLVTLAALGLLGLDGHELLGSVAVVVLFVGAGVLTFRTERDIRIAAQQRRIAGARFHDEP